MQTHIPVQATFKRLVFPYFGFFKIRFIYAFAFSSRSIVNSAKNFVYVNAETTCLFRVHDNPDRISFTAFYQLLFSQ